MATETADVKALEDLAANLGRAKRQLIGRLAERGYQLLREEVPVQTGNLKQGVAPPEVNYEKSEAVLTVSARSAAVGSREATIFGADGKEKKKVTLKAQPGYNYADVTARGNKDPKLVPKGAKAFLIPVPTAPSGEGYLVAGGQIFVVRRSRKAQKANPFHERAAGRLEKEAPGVADAVLKKIFG
jgi:hypothetical protein